MAAELSIVDVDNDIASLEGSRLYVPRTHSEHITSVQILAMARFVRYTLSQQKEDLDKSILRFTEAILLPPASQVQGSSIDVVHLLFRLAFVLQIRSMNFGQPEDIKYSIEYLRYLRGLPLDSFDISRNPVTTSLIQALGFQVRLEADYGTRNIEEMLVLCRELLTSNVSTDLPVGAFNSLSVAVTTEFTQGRPIQLLDGVIECLRDAAKVCPPGSYDIPLALASQLSTRFLETHSNDDYESATALYDTIIDPNQHGECSDSIRVLASSLGCMLAFVRSTIFQNPEYSEVATSRLRTLLGSSSIDERLRFELTQCLAIQAQQRYRNYSLAESLEETDSYVSQVVDLSSPQSLGKSGERFTVSDAVREAYSTTAIRQNIQYLEELYSSTAPGTGRHKDLLSELANWYRTKFTRTNDISDVTESIKYGRLLLGATHHSDLWIFKHLDSLLRTLLLTFEHTNETNYLDEAIIVCYDILKLERGQQIHFHVFQQLVSALLIRLRLLGRREDLDEAIRLIPLAIDSRHAQERDRFRLSCQWAVLARHVSHSSVLTAYKSAMSSMQKSLSFAPTVAIQHTRLVTMGDYYQTLPLDYASYQIDLGLLEEAVETLEQGRALLWSEMRGLRTPIAQLVEKDSPLAKRFAEINQELEALTISITPSATLETEDGVAQGSDGADPFGRLVVKRQKLVEERDALILQIQGRPGLEGFLKTPSFDTLRSAASRGPVILIDHCIWRSDILIIFHNSPPCSIPTASDFYRRANKLRDELVEARKHGLDSDEYQDALSSVLKGLYELVGEPVIERLQSLGVPEQSRIWWCPTSVFCSLPLHAMGPIPSSDVSKRYFSDIYIPSYTPSLSALIESRKESPQMLEKPSLLLVAQPEDSLPGAKGEIKVIEKLEDRVTVTGLVSSEATPAAVVEGLRNNRLAHFACHGELETGKPFDASFKLHGGSRLTLLDIVQSRLPDAEFALLSCCHAAEITEDSIADEGLHLTAAMQYCGFRSVVGTMWAMADTDGQDLAKSFYKSLFSGRRTDVPHYERSARALRDATQKLRKKRGMTLERWVNFVHYGA